ncbi:unnamed protein product [Callosobruchus maculatus]|uniref:Transposase Helix-turn-helix domain-containing protein n=1 Tax=Callosobruchus maculatus TaxID=64391 RepID=A0A653BRA9_CALMS|nr:unnamed protein product [Callosobruchus maculatus]
MHLYNNSALILLTLASVSVALGHILKKRTSRARRTRWSRGWLLRRKGRGTLALLNTELRFEDPEAYRNFLRLDTAQFNVLLNLVRDDINKQDTLMRESISAEHRLNVTLRFLATGESFRSLMYSTRIHESTISKFIPEVCRAIYKHLKVRYIKTPHTQED